MGQRSEFEDRSREYPHGRPAPGEPLILFVCLNNVHRDFVAMTFRDKAHYVLEGHSLYGHQYHNIVTFESYMPPKSFSTRQWYDVLKTRLRPDGTMTHYTYEQQRKLNIVI